MRLRLSWCHRVSSMPSLLVATETLEGRGPSKFARKARSLKRLLGSHWVSELAARRRVSSVPNQPVATQSSEVKRAGQGPALLPGRALNIFRLPETSPESEKPLERQGTRPGEGLAPQKP